MDLRLFDQYFQIYDDKFQYANVSRIRWITDKRPRFLFGIPIGVKRSFTLAIEFRTGPPVQLGPYGFSTDLSDAELRAVDESMQRLFAATRGVRLAGYRAELERAGRFEYDGRMFNADGSVDYKGRRYTLDLNTRPKAIKSHTEIKCLPRGSITVETDWDRDCFHALLSDMHRASAAEVE